MSAPRVGVAASTGWVDADGVVYAAVLPDGPPLVLADTAAVVWRAAAVGGVLDEVVERVAASSGTSAEVVAAAVTAFVDDLVAAGVLTHE